MEIAISNPYKENLNFTLNATIVNLTEIVRSFSYQINRTIDLPDDFDGGTYTLKLNISDTDGRETFKDIDFVVKTTGHIDVVPYKWDIRTIVSGTFSKEFAIVNIGPTILTSIRVLRTGDLDINFSDVLINALNPEETAIIEASFTLEEEGEYDGKIIFGTDITEFTVDVNAVYKENISLNDLVVSPSFLKTATIEDEKVTVYADLVGCSANGM